MRVLLVGLAVLTACGGEPRLARTGLQSGELTVEVSGKPDRTRHAQLSEVGVFDPSGGESDGSMSLEWDGFIFGAYLEGPTRTEASTEVQFSLSAELEDGTIVAFTTDHPQNRDRCEVVIVRSDPAGIEGRLTCDHLVGRIWTYAGSPVESTETAVISIAAAF
jgi:hypothetical protein